MSHEDGNRTVFKPSPLQALKVGDSPPPLKTIAGRPASKAAPPPASRKPAAPEADRPAETRTERPVPASAPTIPPAQAAAPHPAPPQAAPPLRRIKAERNRGASFWFLLAVGAAVALIFLYMVFNSSGLA